MYIPIILLVAFVLYHIVKVRYSAFCASVYKIYCERRSKPTLFLENKVSECMVEVLSNDSDYKDAIRTLKVVSFINIKPFVHIFETGDFHIVDEIRPNINNALKKFKEGFKDIL